MSEHPHLIARNPDTPHTDASWRDGSLRYDHSQDEELASEGDAAAEARLRTRSRLKRAQLAKGPAAYGAT